MSEIIKKDNKIITRVGETEVIVDKDSIKIIADKIDLEGQRINA